MSDKVSNGGAQVFQTVNREARLSDKVTAAILETIAGDGLRPHGAGVIAGFQLCRGL